MWVVYSSKQFVVFSLCVVLLVVVLAYGLKEILPSESQTEPIVVERVFDEWGLKLSMSVEKATYAYGEPVNITFTLKNIGNETIKIEFAGLSRRFDFSVYNSTDIFNISARIYCDLFHAYFPATDTVILNGGESLTSTMQWFQSSFYYETIQVPPGKYYIFEVNYWLVHVERNSIRYDVLDILRLEDPIGITILPP